MNYQDCLHEMSICLVFILYVVFVILMTLAIIFYVAPKYGRSNILVFIAVCSLIGSLSVISVKGLGLAIKETLSGHQQLSNLLTWFWLLAVVACVSVQLVCSFVFIVRDLTRLDLFEQVPRHLQHVDG